MTTNPDIQATDPAGAGKRAGRLFYSCCMALALAVTAIFTLMPIEVFIARGFVIPDSLVYARVAYNAAHGLGSTYDLITVTNGYHPLWLLMQVPLMYGADTIMERLWLMKALWVATAFGASLVWSAYMARLTRSQVASGAMLLLMSCFGWSLFVLYSGMETPLVLFFLGLVLLASDRPGGQGYGTGRAALIGLLLGLAFLSRIDMVFIGVPLALAMLWRSRGSIRAQTALIAGGLLVSLPYLLWNYLNFGKITPVSGIAKTVNSPSIAGSLEHLHAFNEKISRIGVSPVMLYAVLFAVVLVFLWILYTRRERLDRKYMPVALVFMGAVLHYSYYFVFITELNVTWHLYPQVLAVYLALVLILNFTYTWVIERTGKRGLLAGLLLSVFVFSVGVLDFGYMHVKSVRAPESLETLKLGRWIDRNVPEDSIIVFHDSFFAASAAPRHAIIDANGLVGDRKMAEIARFNRAVSHEEDRKDFVNIYNADYVSYWVTGHCEVREPWVIEYHSPLLETNRPKMLVFQKSVDYRTYGRYGALTCR